MSSDDFADIIIFRFRFRFRFRYITVNKWMLIYVFEDFRKIKSKKLYFFNGLIANK